MVFPLSSHLYKPYTTYTPPIATVVQIITRRTVLYYARHEYDCCRAESLDFTLM